MHTVLAIDTTTAACSAALSLRGEVISRFRLASREHTRLLLPMVNELLEEGGICLNQLDALAFTHGPGSFTGIRIGFGVVQGLAFGANIPVCPVSSLETLALTGLSKQEPAQEPCIVMPMFDARMDEVYWAQFEWRDGQLTRLCEDSLSLPEDLPTPASPLAVHGFGDGWNYAQRISISPTLLNREALPDALDVLTLAMPQIAHGATQAVTDVQPLYLRDKVTWKKRQRLREQKSEDGRGEACL